LAEKDELTDEEADELEALDAEARERVPLDWAMTQNNLGNRRAGPRRKQ
jgi:hypothetical protein